MDTYENEELISDPVPEETEQPVQEQAEEETSQGFYHGVGAGTKEETYTVSAQPVCEEQPICEPQPEPIAEKKQGRSLFTRVMSVVAVFAVVLAMIAAGYGVTVGVLNDRWQENNEMLIARLNEQIKVLEQMLEEKDYSNINITMNAEGKLPSQIYEQNIQSVVAINCIYKTTSNGRVYESVSSGSGFVFDVIGTTGYIATNHHVVSEAATNPQGTTIQIVTADGQKLNASFIGSDANNDIALLKVNALALQPVTLGSSSQLLVGEQVVAIGNALGELSFSLTAGYVSGMDRDVATDGTVINMIQTDAAINSGNSGGPLFNARGEVVGIISAKYSGTSSSGAIIEGIGFAIPMDDVRDMLEDLRDYGKITGVKLGVYVQEVDATVSETYGLPMGAYVKEVISGGCAEAAGIIAKDIITNVGGYTVEDLNDLTRALRKFKAGEQSTITVWRSGRTLILNIIFDEKT